MSELLPLFYGLQNNVSKTTFSRLISRLTNKTYMISTINREVKCADIQIGVAIPVNLYLTSSVEDPMFKTSILFQKEII